MLEILLAPLLSLSPQDPATTAAPPQASATAPEQWLPASTLAAIMVAPIPEVGAVTQLWQSAPGRRLAAILERPLQPLAAQFDAAPDELAQALRHGIALAWLGFTPAGDPDVLLVAEVGDAAALVERALLDLPRAASQGEGLRRISIPGGPIVYVRLHESRVACGTVAASVQAAIARMHGHDRESLRAAPEFERVLPARDNLVAFFARPDRIVQALRSLLPAGHREVAQNAIAAVGIDRLTGFGMGYRLEGEDLVADGRLDAGRLGGLLAALAGQPGRLDKNLARFVPPAATSFGFGAVDLGAVLGELIALVAAMDPAPAMMIEGTMDNVRERTGVDVQKELLQGFGGRIASVTLPPDGEMVALGMLFELKNPAGFGKALGKALAALPVPLQSGKVAGVPCWRLPSPDHDGPAPALAVVGTWLAFGSSDAVLSQLVRQVQRPQPNERALALLRDVPATATWAGEGSGMMLPGEPFAALREQVSTLGPRRTWLLRTADGLQWIDRVAARDVLRAGAAVATMVGRMAGIDDSDLPPLDGPSLPARPPSAAAFPDVDPRLVARLRQLEAEGPGDETVAALLDLLQHESGLLAGRAAFLLGQWRAEGTAAPLSRAALTHPDAEARTQAAQALTGLAGPEEVDALMQLCHDADRRVRTLALTTLSRLAKAVPQQVAKTEVLAVAQELLDRHGSTASRGPATDLVAALLVLNDLGDSSQLLPAAAAIGIRDTKVGEALAFLFQSHSQGFARAAETAAMLAVLDHPEPLLRRFAIQRLGELRDPAAARALEGRLAVEGPDLQPLVRVSLTAVRGDDVAPADDLVARAKHNATLLAQMAERKWRELDQRQQHIVLGGAGGVLLLLLVAMLLRRRRRRQQAAAEAAALVGPSSEFLAEQAQGEDAFHDGYGDDNVQYDYAEEEYAGSGDRR